MTRAGIVAPAVAITADDKRLNADKPRREGAGL